ncbi:Uncharacterised protein [uncultured archaeon]|nr:Uncharacterised protein [uncultured archaeon]
MKKGQASIEFMFLILISIVYITTAVVPMARNAQGLVYDTENVSRTNSEAQKIVNAITNISMQSTGSRETVTIFVPADSNISCFPAKISFATTLKEKPFPGQCDSLSGLCTKDFTLPASAQMDCKIKGISGPVATKVIIEKQATTVAFYQ